MTPEMPLGQPTTIKGSQTMQLKKRSRPTRTLKSENEERAGQRAEAFVNAFRNIRQTMPLQYLTAFLLVARDEGQSVSEYARRAGVSVSVMSRHLLDIGDRTRHDEEGFGLVTFQPRPHNLREHEYVLTNKGRMLWGQIVSIME
jgi:DNA-binding MarR family transcriptional regulator